MKDTLTFAYWINAQSDILQPEEWTACYFLKLETGITQVDANRALALGYLLDPTTPTLAEWVRIKEKKR